MRVIVVAFEVEELSWRSNEVHDNKGEIWAWSTILEAAG